MSVYKRGEPKPLETFQYEHITFFGASQPCTYKIIVDEREMYFETPLVRAHHSLSNHPPPSAYFLSVGFDTSYLGCTNILFHILGRRDHQDYAGLHQHDGEETLQHHVCVQCCQCLGQVISPSQSKLFVHPSSDTRRLGSLHWLVVFYKGQSHQPAQPPTLNHEQGMSINYKNGEKVDTEAKCTLNWPGDLLIP